MQSKSKTIKHNLTNVVPLPQDLKVGEITIYYSDGLGKLFTKTESGEVIEIGQGVLNFRDLEDVDVGNIDRGELEEGYVVYEDSKFIVKETIGSIKSLENVETSNEQNGEYLRLDDLTESYINYKPTYSLSEITDIEIGDLTDQVYSSSINNFVLEYDDEDKKFKPTARRNLISQLLDVEVTDSEYSQILSLDTDGIWKNVDLDISLDPNPTLGNDLDANGYAITNSGYKVNTIVCNEPIKDLNYSDGDYWIIDGVASNIQAQCIINLNIFPKEDSTAICLLEIRQSSGAIVLAGLENIHYEDGKPIQLSGSGKTDLVTILVQFNSLITRRFYNAPYLLPNRSNILYPLTYQSICHLHRGYSNNLINTQINLRSFNSSILTNPLISNSFSELNNFLTYLNTTFSYNYIAIVQWDTAQDTQGLLTGLSRIKYKDDIGIVDDLEDNLVDYADHIFVGSNPSTNQLNNIKNNYFSTGNNLYEKTITGIGTIKYLIFDLDNGSFIRFLDLYKYTKYKYFGSLLYESEIFNALYPNAINKYDNTEIYPINNSGVIAFRNGLSQVFDSLYVNTTLVPLIKPVDVLDQTLDVGFITQNSNVHTFFSSNVGYSLVNKSREWKTFTGALINAIIPGALSYRTELLNLTISSSSLELFLMRLIREENRFFNSWRDLIDTWRNKANYRTYIECPDWLLIWEYTATQYGYFSEQNTNPSFIDIWLIPNYKDLFKPFNVNWLNFAWDDPISNFIVVNELKLPQYLSSNSNETRVYDLNESTISIEEYITKWGSYSKLINLRESSYITTDNSSNFNNLTINEGTSSGNNGRDNQGNIISQGWVYSQYKDRYKSYITLSALNLAKVGQGGVPSYRYDKSRYPGNQLFSNPALYDDYFDYVRVLLNFEPENSSGKLWYHDKSHIYDEINDTYFENIVNTNTSNVAINTFTFGIQEYISNFFINTNFLTLEKDTNSDLILTGDFTIEFYLSFQNENQYRSNTDIDYSFISNSDASFYLKYLGKVENNDVVSSNLQTTKLELKIGTNTYQFENSYYLFDKQDKQWVHLAVTRENETVRLFINGVYLNPSVNYVDTGITDIDLSEINIYLQGYLNSYRVSEYCRYKKNFQIPAMRFGLLAGYRSSLEANIFDFSYNLGTIEFEFDDYIANEIFN